VSRARPPRTEFALKLRVTAAFLGCATRKDLCARFRAVNPATDADLERVHKWLQGRALPRSSRIYDDWARLVGTGRPPHWLATCTTRQLLDELATLHGADPDRLLALAGAGGGPASEAADRRPGGHYLCGAYACYSHAWSPYYAGHLIRGGLGIEEHAPGEPLLATYVEALPVGALRLSGPITPGARWLTVLLAGSVNAAPLFVSASTPSPPASVLLGILTGVTMMGPDPRPSATRIAMVRVPARPERLEASGRYLLPDEGSIVGDLAGLGLRMPGPAAVDRLMRDFLRPDPGATFDQVRHEEVARLTAELDRGLVADPRHGRDDAAAGSGRSPPPPPLPRARPDVPDASDGTPPGKVLRMK
jgi:hypothetical protein